MKTSPEKTTIKPTKKHRSATKLLLALVLILCGVGMTLGAQYGLEQYFGDQDSILNPSEGDGNKLTSDDETSVAAVAKAVSPSVVSISSESLERGARGNVGVLRGAGSGIIVTKSGYVLTNKHVVENARSLQITTSDGRLFENVELVATDPLNDLAFLKINDASDLPAAELGDSSSVSVGQKVVAIGNSLGQYQNTVTTGIISGKGRPIAAQNGSNVESLTDLLQTDAAINPGNSGGPLLNMSGQVIGINTAIAKDAEGIGFAIPVNAAKGLLKQIVAGNEDPERAYLGVRYLPVDAAVARRYSLDTNAGAFVTAGPSQQAIAGGSPADKAGLEEGDIIIKVGDKQIGVDGGLTSLISAFAPGEKVEITYLRDDTEQTATVELAAYPGQ